jgi:glycosyltransferase involved in cell wall biosynthesis
VSRTDRPARAAGRRDAVPDRPPPRVLFNLTAYDALASGARERALGLAGALLRLGAEVIAAEPRGADLASLVPVPPGAQAPRSIRTGLDAGRPLERFRRSRGVFEEILRAEAPDAFVTDFYPVPRVPGVRTAVTIHDLRDLAGAAPGRPLRRAYFSAVYGRALRDAALVATPSVFTRDEAVGRLGLDPGRTAVVPNAVPEALRAPPDPAAEARIRERLDLPRRPYLLALGVLEARKNVGRLLEALDLLHREGAEVPALVVAGRGGPEEAALRRGAERLPRGAVHWAGYVRPAELPALYDGARALVHPATYEGFGMPVVEAMARGVPVACADATALPETAGGAALLFDPGDARAVAGAVVEVSHNETLRAALVRRGRARAASLTFDASARALLDALGLAVAAR